MKIPKKLKIGGHTVKVSHHNHTFNNTDGSWCSEDNEICIKKSLPMSQKEVTLIHEILHSINNSMDEVKIEFLAQTLYQVIIDNKLVFDGKDEK